MLISYTMDIIHKYNLAGMETSYRWFLVNLYWMELSSSDQILGPIQPRSEHMFTIVYFVSISNAS